MRVESVTARLAAALRDRLSRCRGAAAMFRVCGRFNALFFRPAVRAVVADFEPQLLKEVRGEAERPRPCNRHVTAT